MVGMGVGDKEGIDPEIGYTGPDKLPQGCVADIDQQPTTAGSKKITGGVSGQ